MRDLIFCIDRGGTFTDCICYQGSGGSVWVEKLLSVDPENYQDAPREGIRRLLERITGNSYPKHQPIDTGRISSIRMATTVATNSLLERTGERFALLTTRGFKDLWVIGNQSRPDIFDLSVSGRPTPLYHQVIEVRERVTLLSDDVVESETEDFRNSSVASVEIGVTGERVAILERLDENQLREDLQRLHSEHGISHLAVVLMHSFAYPRHEQRVREIARELGCFTDITISSDLMPMIKILPRGHSSCVDAYLTPGIQRYVHSFAAGFDSRFSVDVEVLFMQSDGALVPMERFSGLKAILSGPAGGVVGYARTSFSPNQQPVIGFDMGGTSTDVSRYDGQFKTISESETAGVTIQAPHLDINTIAAGGGSRLFYENGLFRVGPESAGAHPGPACYRKGGPLTITDANLVLGRLLPQYFPKIFGPDENEPLDVDASRKLFAALAIKRDNGETMSIEEMAMGFIRVANEAMCRPIRAITRSRGFETSKHLLACFGGAGGQHSCSIARQLGIQTILVHRYASVLSAYGLGLASVAVERQEPCSLELCAKAIPEIEKGLKKLRVSCVEQLQMIQDHSNIQFELYLNLRFQGTDCALMILGEDLDSWLDQFTTTYRREFGFLLEDRPIIIDDLRVRALYKSPLDDGSQMDDLSPRDDPGTPPSAAPLERCQVYFSNIGCQQQTVVYRLESLRPMDVIQGPAIILDQTNTILVEPDCRAYITARGNIAIHLHSSEIKNKSTPFEQQSVDPIQLSIFSHRFMGIAEQMGYALQRTAVSTNIKERLDFSCALFAPDGGLVANAPHIPVHLGSMQEAVRYQLNHHAKDLLDGNVLVSNHPQAGGSHLPDITVITPVFAGDNNLAFFVASRGHHADIGGVSPGSMPPHSKRLFEEGAMIKSFLLVHQGRFDEAGITQLLFHDPMQYPGCSGTRNLRDNLSDLRAQIAANQRGVQLVKELIGEYGLPMVHSYMFHIRQNAENTVRQLLRASALGGATILEAEDWMDDGTPVRLRVEIDPKDGGAIFDFNGTGPQVFGNINAPPAITYSAVIYALRCMVSSDIPLNQGCLAPVHIKLPSNSILCPADNMAVVGGNVLTSQRVVDVILKAFGAAAASQGCMNNLTFGVPPEHGRSGWGYYETICGGSGAGPKFPGQSGVHTHMTNTRITDPEILERRYPVILREFSLRRGSGGRGRFNGGDGVVREIQFCVPIQVSILSERRVHRPFGLAGGEAGLAGLNLLVAYKTGIATNLGGKNTFMVSAGDKLRILTPGGGGFGNFSC